MVSLEVLGASSRAMDSSLVTYSMTTNGADLIHLLLVITMLNKANMDLAVLLNPLPNALSNAKMNQRENTPKTKSRLRALTLFLLMSRPS